MKHPTYRTLHIILCSVSGMRLWPISRESMPKQLARLVGLAASTFLATAKRVTDSTIFSLPHSGRRRRYALHSHQATSGLS